MDSLVRRPFFPSGHLEAHPTRRPTQNQKIQSSLPSTLVAGNFKELFLYFHDQLLKLWLV